MNGSLKQGSAVDFLARPMLEEGRMFATEDGASLPICADWRDPRSPGMQMLASSDRILSSLVQAAQIEGKAT